MIFYRIYYAINGKRLEKQNNNEKRSSAKVMKNYQNQVTI